MENHGHRSLFVEIINALKPKKLQKLTTKLYMKQQTNKKNGRVPFEREQSQRVYCLHKRHENLIYEFIKCSCMSR